MGEGEGYLMPKYLVDRESARTSNREGRDVATVRRRWERVELARRRAGSAACDRNTVSDTTGSFLSSRETGTSEKYGEPCVYMYIYIIRIVVSALLTQGPRSVIVRISRLRASARYRGMRYRAPRMLSARARPAICLSPFRFIVRLQPKTRLSARVYRERDMTRGAGIYARDITREILREILYES